VYSYWSLMYHNGKNRCWMRRHMLCGASQPRMKPDRCVNDVQTEIYSRDKEVLHRKRKVSARTRKYFFIFDVPCCNQL
jgi:hypothetical protein